MLTGRLPLEVFLGTSYWEKAPRETQNSLEGLYVPSGLGTPRDPTGGAGECHWGEGCVGFSPELVAPSTRPRISGR